MVRKLILASAATLFSINAFAADCNASSNSCSEQVLLLGGSSVTWSFLSQSSNEAGFKVTYESGGATQTLVDTNLSPNAAPNATSGAFIAPRTGRYTVTFTNTQALVSSEMNVFDNAFENLSSTKAFATDANGDGVLKDVYGTISWHRPN